MAKAEKVNRHIAWCTSPYPCTHSVRWMPGWWLASGDQRRLTGSGSAWGVFATMRYTNPQFTLLYLLNYFTQNRKHSVPCHSVASLQPTPSSHLWSSRSQLLSSKFNTAVAMSQCRVISTGWRHKNTCHLIWLLTSYKAPTDLCYFWHRPKT